MRCKFRREGKFACSGTAEWSLTEVDSDGSYGFTHDACSSHLGEVAKDAIKGWPDRAAIEWIRLEKV